MAIIRTIFLPSSNVYKKTAMSKSRCLDSEELAINRQKLRIFHINLQIEYYCQKLREYLYQGKSPGTTRLETKVPKTHTPYIFTGTMGKFA